MKDLHAKIVLVTGAGAGIGRATAEAFARAGSKLIVCDVDEARVEQLTAALGDAVILAARVDVASREEMAAFAADVHGSVGAIDILVNNAGVAVSGAFLDTSLDDWDWLLGVNLKGVVHGCHFFLPPMVRRGSGHIVNISSVLGFTPVPDLTAYCASKYAVLGLSQALRHELAPQGVGVSAICPGLIATSIVADGRFAGASSQRRSGAIRMFATKGSRPAVVAEAILRAVRDDISIMPAARDAWALWALSRLPTSVRDRLIRRATARGLASTASH